MKTDIKRISIGELKDFISSSEFKSFETIPVSPVRAISYLNNPHANADDYVLYLLYSENELIAFRTLFPDVIYFENETTKFAWLSGSWVHSEYRRKGLSMQLLKQIVLDWNTILLTNYAPNSEKLYLKSSYFKAIHNFEGARAYLKPKSGKLLSSKRISKLAVLLSLIDGFISIYAKLMSFFFRMSKNDLQFKLQDYPDQECYSNIKQNKNSILFRRKEELEWIFKYPWIKTESTDLLKNYPFSSFSEQFYYKTVKVFKSNKFLGFLIFSVRDGHLKTLYFSLEEKYIQQLDSFIKDYSIKNSIEMLTIYNKTLANKILHNKFPFVFVKPYGQKIYASKKLIIPGNSIFQDGESDVFFT